MIKFNKKKKDLNELEKNQEEGIIGIPTLLDNHRRYINFPNNPIKKRKKLKKNDLIKSINTENSSTIKKKSISLKNEDNAKENASNIININLSDNQKIIEKCKIIMSFNYSEMNNLDYNLALKYDQRSYCEYYISLIKTKHILIVIFFNNKDYNSRIIKLDLFFISFAISYTLNALFFSDGIKHKIYEDKGIFKLLYQIPQILYSFIISAV